MIPRSLSQELKSEMLNCKVGHEACDAQRGWSREKHERCLLEANRGR